MKILIAFATRYGTTERCAEILKNILTEKQHEVIVIDLKKNKKVTLKDYDAVVIGGSFMMFRMNSLVIKFVKSNLDTLLKMKTGLFMCGADDKWEEEIKKGFPEELLKNAAVQGYFGYEMNWDRMSPIFRGMMQKSYNTTEPVRMINKENIEKFADQIAES